MKLAVTGISSYLARTVFPRLEADSAIEEIRGLDLKEPSFRSAKLRFQRADVRDPGLARFLQGCDTLLHLAFIVMPIRDEAQADDINIAGSKNVFRAAAEAGLRKIVYSSSVAAYGAWPENPEFITEDQPVRGMPAFYYSRAKAAVELFLDEFQQEHPNLIITRFRPCIFVGPTIENAVKNLVSAKIVPRFPGRNLKLQLVWDEDVAQAISLAIRGDFPGAFNLAGDNPLTMPDLAKVLDRPCLPLPFALASAAMKILWPLHLSGQLSPGWVECIRDSIIVSSEKAKRVLGWKPSCDTAGALRRLIETLPKA
jgi:nucleoside-diphosphate-sugar epimerase